MRVARVRHRPCKEKLMSAPYFLRLALQELVKGTPQKQRLVAAFSNYLVEIDATELPSSVRAEFIALCAELEAVQPLPGESAVQATVRKLSAAEADRCAGRIVAVAAALFGEHAEAAPRHGRERGDGDDTVIPLFAAEA